MSTTKTTAARDRTDSQASAAIQFAHQAERLGYENDDGQYIDSGAVEARFVTGQDPVIQLASGDRLPAVPIEEAVRLNDLKDKVQGKDPNMRDPITAGTREGKDGVVHGALLRQSANSDPKDGESLGDSLRDSVPDSKTNPLFPPMPMYGPPSLLRNLQCWLFRFTAFFGSLAFLLVIVLGAAFTSLPLAARHIWIRLQLKDPDARRPFYDEEKKRQRNRREAEQVWGTQSERRKRRLSGSEHSEQGEGNDNRFPPLEGGPDPLICDAAYYARRVGLDIEEYEVQTEDGFIISLWHVYNPREQQPARPELRRFKSARVFRERFAQDGLVKGTVATQYENGNRKYPVLLMHGLLQSAGAFCCNEDDSLAFFLAKSGYDVWLGNNRCGFSPKHSLLEYADPRMWAWNIRQMGVMDLPALISRVLEETGFEKLGLVAHSQGTTQTFVALAKEQRPDIGARISVFCALAPAVYAGPLIKKFYFKIMRAITPYMFRLIFGIHAFIPLMMIAHRTLPARLYGSLGYRVFSFLFNWSDDRWEQDLRDRMFQFAPTYVSSESMRWWLGRECFAKHKCILATKMESHLEDEEDEEEDDYFNLRPNAAIDNLSCHCDGHYHREHERYAWYDDRAPPMALWIAGHDDLVDGRRLLRRFDRGREPHVNIVHRKIIEGYEHLDVIWSMDAIDKVASEVRATIWHTAEPQARAVCRTPLGCEGVGIWTRPTKAEITETIIDATSGGPPGTPGRTRADKSAVARGRSSTLESVVEADETVEHADVPSGADKDEVEEKRSQEVQEEMDYEDDNDDDNGARKNKE